jgi:twitching motility protein PilT
MVRVDGELMPLDHADVISATIAHDLVYSLLTTTQQEVFERDRDLDISYELRDTSRFRVNLHWERGHVGLVARVIPPHIPTLEELTMPPLVGDLLRVDQGLILVTGPTGCGKSTSLASMIETINNERAANIVTLEDPVEFIFEPKLSIIRQRQLGTDITSFPAGLKHVLRQDPNVIMVGEMRDLETIATTITLAETGHLVLATLHTADCAQTINRVVDVFPEHQIEQVRIQLSFVLQAVMSQQLLSHASGSGRVLACETMIVNSAIRNLIRDQKIEQMQSAIQTGGKTGMQTMNQSLAEHYFKQRITFQEAMAHSLDPEDLRRLMQRQMSAPRT